MIFIIDDDSNDKSIYHSLHNNNKIRIIYEKDIMDRDIASDIYKKIKDNFIWMIFVDVDEFITTKKNLKNTIRQELETTFKNNDCIKIPWVMMGCNNIQKNPESILKTNIYRWNHNKKHPHPVYKFRCRYWNIEVKCIFKTNKFNDIHEHNPIEPLSKQISIVDSIKKKKQELRNHYPKLREKNIHNGYLLCYHYRIISRENSENKLKNNKMYKEHKYTIDDLMKSDYSEIIDETLKNKIP